MTLAPTNVNYTKYDFDDADAPRFESVDSTSSTEEKKAKEKEKDTAKDKEQGKDSESSKKASGQSPYWGAKKDALNLTGLLNVLDGVVDSPGRIVIMTTNHVEHLDPALIRPGRIDKRLFLGYMQPVDICAMLEHYFQLELNGSQRWRIENAILGRMDVVDTLTGGHGISSPSVNLTPAQVEQMSCEHDCIEDMIRALEGKGRPAVVACTKLASRGESSSQQSRGSFSVSKSNMYFDGLFQTV